MATSFLEVKNRAESTLASAITAAALSLSVASGEGAGFPSSGTFHITIDDEILACTSRSTDTLTVTREAQSTTAAVHSATAVVSLNVTAQNISDLNTAVNTLEAEVDTLEADVPTFVAKGDTRYASAAATGAVLTVGATNTVLHVASGIPAWSATLAGLTLTTPIIASLYQVSGGGLISVPASAGADTVCLIGATQTLTLKTLTTPIVASLYQDAGKTKLMTVPDTASDTLAAVAATQTLTNKTLTTPIIATLYQDAGKTLLLTMPAATDTLVGKATTDVLTNKTLTAPTLNGTVTLGSTPIFDAGSGDAQIITTGSGGGLRIISTNDATGGVLVLIQSVSTTPDAEDTVGRLLFRGKDADAPQNNTDYMDIRAVIADATADSEDGRLDIYSIAAGAQNLALTLSGAGVLAVDLSGGGAAAQVDLFDEYDDALVLRQGIQQRNRDLLCDMGVLERKDTGSGYMLKLQPMINLLAGGIYQTRQMLEDVRDELSGRLSLVEKKPALLLGG